MVSKNVNQNITFFNHKKIFKSQLLQEEQQVIAFLAHWKMYIPGHKIEITKKVFQITERQ